MGDFKFRLRFHLPPFRHITAEGQSLALPTAADNSLLLTVYTPDGSELKDATKLVLWGGPYTSEQDARKAADRARYALIRWGIEVQMGLDFGKDVANVMFFKPFVDAHLQATGSQLLPDVHGVIVFDASHAVTFGSSGATLRLGKGRDPLIEAFRDHFQSAATLNAKQQVSYELFSSSQFEWSPRSRLLMLVMAVEALLDPEPRDCMTRKHVRRLIEKTARAWIPRGQKDSLLGSLAYLDRESIGQSSRRLIRTLLGNRKYKEVKAADFFTQCYSMRSKLVHYGHLQSSDPDVRDVVGDLESLVADLHKALVRR